MEQERKRRDGEQREQKPVVKMAELHRKQRSWGKGRKAGGGVRWRV